MNKNIETSSKETKLGSHIRSIEDVFEDVFEDII